MSVQHIRNLSQQIYLETSSLKRGNNAPKLPGVDYVAFIKESITRAMVVTKS